MQNQPLTTTTPVQLPVEGTVAIFVRLAAEQEHVRDSSHPHRTTDDLVALARSMGWTDEHITVYEERGISGKAPIEERLGFKALLDAIQQGSIQAILVSDEYRLFRDAAAIQVNTFIHLCQEHSVKVVTLQMIYDFSNPTHVQLFRFLVETGSFAVYARTIIGRRYRNWQQKRGVRSLEGAEGG